MRLKYIWFKKERPISKLSAKGVWRMVKEGEELRSNSTGELFVVKQVRENTVVLEMVNEREQVLTWGENLCLNERDDEWRGCEFDDFGC
jgi:hypothetical protein